MTVFYAKMLNDHIQKDFRFTIHPSQLNKERMRNASINRDTSFFLNIGKSRKVKVKERCISTCSLVEKFNQEMVII